MKKIALLLVVCMVASLFAGCAGTPVVYYSDCTCPTGAHDETQATEATEPVETVPQETQPSA